MPTLLDRPVLDPSRPESPLVKPFDRRHIASEFDDDGSRQPAPWRRVLAPFAWLFASQPPDANRFRYLSVLEPLAPDPRRGARFAPQRCCTDDPSER